MKLKKTAAPVRSTPKAPERLFALTVKVNQELYARLTALRGKEGRNHQEILKSALEEYLRRQEA